MICSKINSALRGMERDQRSFLLQHDEDGALSQDTSRWRSDLLIRIIDSLRILLCNGRVRKKDRRGFELLLTVFFHTHTFYVGRESPQWQRNSRIRFRAITCPFGWTCWSKARRAPSTNCSRTRTGISRPRLSRGSRSRDSISPPMAAPCIAPARESRFAGKIEDQSISHVTAITATHKSKELGNDEIKRRLTKIGKTHRAVYHNCKRGG